MNNSQDASNTAFTWMNIPGMRPIIVQEPEKEVIKHVELRVVDDEPEQLELPGAE